MKKFYYDKIGVNLLLINIIFLLFKDSAKSGNISEQPTAPVEYTKRGPKKILLLLVGIISLILAIVGIFLPLLPTTPFLLLSATCFAKSSERLYNWLMNHKHFGAIIKNYRGKKAVSLHSKIYALVLLWTTILSSAIFFVPIFWVKVLLLCIASAVTYHILRLKTLR